MPRRDVANLLRGMKSFVALDNGAPQIEVEDDPIEKSSSSPTRQPKSGNGRSRRVRKEIAQERASKLSDILVHASDHESDDDVEDRADETSSDDEEEVDLLSERPSKSAGKLSRPTPRVQPAQKAGQASFKSASEISRKFLQPKPSAAQGHHKSASEFSRQRPQVQPKQNAGQVPFNSASDLSRRFLPGPNMPRKMDSLLNRGSTSNVPEQSEPRSQWRKIYQTEGIGPLAKAVFDHCEKTRERGTLGVSWETFARAVVPVIMCLPHEMLCACLDHDLNKQYVQGHDAVRKSADQFTLLARKYGVPCIYLRVHSDAKGDAPTVNQYFSVIQQIRSYVSKDDPLFAYQVDSAMDATSWKQDWSRRGLRRYLTKHPWSPLEEGEESPFHRPNGKIDAKNFCSLFEQRLRSIPKNEWDSPLSWPMSYVGWTSNFMSRLRSHESHEGSNLNMCLIQVVSDLLFPNTFSMSTYVVGLIAAEEQAPAAETFFTIVAGGYKKTGGGFASSDAGASTHSTEYITAKQWSIHTWCILEFTDYNNSAAREAARLERVRQARQEFDEASQDCKSVRSKIAVCGQTLEFLKKEEEHRWSAVVEDAIKTGYLDLTEETVP